MNVNFEAIEKAWFKPKKDEKYILEKIEEYAKQLYEEPSWASCGARKILEKIQELKKENENG